MILTFNLRPYYMNFRDTLILRISRLKKNREIKAVCEHNMTRKLSDSHYVTVDMDSPAVAFLLILTLLYRPLIKTVY